MSRRGHRLTEQDRERIATAVERMRVNNDRLTALFRQLIEVLTHNRPELKALLERPEGEKLH